MPASTNSTMSSSLPSLSPSPRSGSTTSAAAVSATSAPPPPPPPPAPPVRERKKPGPKPKPKIPPSKILKLSLKPELLAKFPHVSNGKAKSKTTQNSSPPTAQTSPGRDGSSPVNSDATPVPPPERPRGIPGPKPGSKRTRQPGALLGKPGRKKAKLYVCSDLRSFFANG